MNQFFKNVWRKWYYSVSGILTAVKEEKSIWSYFVLYALIIGLGIFLNFSFIAWAIVILGIFMTLTVEIINTALEAAVDAMSFQYNIKVKKIKDIASGATFVSTIGTLIAWTLIIADAFIKL